MRVDVPECGGEQGPNEEGAEGDAQHGGQDEAFVCARKGGMAAVSAAAPTLAPYRVGLARSTGLGVSPSSAPDPDFSGPQSSHLADGFITPVPGTEPWLF